MKILFYIIVISLLTSCTSVVSSSVALVVSLHSQKVEKDTRRYKKLDECLIPNTPEPFSLAESIFYGIDLIDNYKIILDPEQRDKKDIDAYSLTYVFYVISDRIGDKRAKQRMNAMQVYIDSSKAYEIEEFIHYKYLNSYLNKCFTLQKELKQTS